MRSAVLWVLAGVAAALFVATAIMAGLACTALDAQAAQLSVRGTAVTQFSSVLCGPAAGVLDPLVPLTVHIRWWVAGTDSTSAAVAGDSLVAMPGSPFSFAKNGVPAGLYRIRSWCNWAPSEPGCDTTITKLLPGRGTKIADFRSP
jgi:hypothetical protein